MRLWRRQARRVQSVTSTIWTESTRDELRAALPESVVIIPTGATEQHGGPHLVTGHDTFPVVEVVQRAAVLATGSFVIAPALPFGSSQHHLPFGATLSLSTGTYYRVVRELVESEVAAGAESSC